MEASLNLTAIQLLPAPTAVQFHALTLDGFHTSKGFDQMTLNPGISFSLIAQLPANHRRSSDGEANKEGDYGQSPDCELHAIEKHDSDINQGKTSIQNHRKGCSCEKSAYFLKFINSATHLANGSLGEISQRQPEKMVDNGGPQGDINAIGGIREEIGSQRSQDCLGHSHTHQERAQHIEAAEITLAYHRINDLLNQQWIQKSKQLNKKAGNQHLDQHDPMLHQRR